MGKRRTYTDEQFIEAVSTSRSIRQILSKLGLKEAGGNYASCRNLITRLGLNINHLDMPGQSWRKDMKFGPKRPIEDYLSNRYPLQSHKLKLRLLEEGYFEHKCSNCLLYTWLEKPIPLELDHIDGNSRDNSLTNLRLLCPNCHSLTPTYRGKNIGRDTRTCTETVIKP